MREADRLKSLKQPGAQKPRPRSLESGLKQQRYAAARGSYAEKLQQAGITLRPAAWMASVIGVCTAVGLLLGQSVGVLAGFGVPPLLAAYFLNTHLSARAQRRRREAVPHLPAFVDTLSASLQAGYSIEEALQHAAAALPEGVLKKEFGKVVQMIENRVTLSEALPYISSSLCGQEIISLVISLRLFADLGGTLLTPFERLASKLREQQAVLERAARDLVGVKQAFYVILGLSIGAPAVLLLTEPDYISSAFNHPWIRYVMQGSVVLQVSCILFFKRLTAFQA